MNKFKTMIGILLMITGFCFGIYVGVYMLLMNLVNMIYNETNVPFLLIILVFRELAAACISVWLMMLGKRIYRSAIHRSKYI